MRTSFHTGILGHLPVLEAIAEVRGAGYDGVELNAETLPWTGPHVDPDTSQDVRRAIAATNAVSSIAAHREGLASPNPERRRIAVDWTIGCAQLAVDIGTDIIHVIPGDSPEGAAITVAAEPGDLGSFIDSLSRIVAAAEPLGVKVSLEPIVNQLVANTDQALYVLDAVPGLGISFDPSHLEVTTHDVDDAARRLGGRTMIAAIKDGAGESEDFTFPRLGTGNIDFVSMIRTLRGTGFDGYLVVEHEAHLFGDTRPPSLVLVESYEFLRRQLDLAMASAPAN